MRAKVHADAVKGSFKQAKLAIPTLVRIWDGQTLVKEGEFPKHWEPYDPCRRVVLRVMRSRDGDVWIEEKTTFAPGLSFESDLEKGIANYDYVHGPKWWVVNGPLGREFPDFVDRLRRDGLRMQGLQR